VPTRDVTGKIDTFYIIEIDFPRNMGRYIDVLLLLVSDNRYLVLYKNLRNNGRYIRITSLSCRLLLLERLAKS
jgi:hypothetical protein